MQSLISIERILMYVCMYVCLYVCMYVYMYVCMFVYMYVCMYVCKRVSLHTTTVYSSSIVETIVEIAYLFNDISIITIVISQLSRTVVYFCFCYPHIADNRHQNHGSSYSWLAEYHG
jgi:hypothetical protein